jgi:CRP-like cAMP-binding protein
LKHPKISVTSTDEDIVARVANLFEVKYHRVKRRKQHWKHAWVVKKGGYAAVELMKELQPFMGKRRNERIQEIVSDYKSPKSRRPTAAEIEKIVTLCQANKETQKVIGAKFGYTRETVNHIWRRHQKQMVIVV